MRQHDFHEHVCPACNGYWSHTDTQCDAGLELYDPLCEAEVANALIVEDFENDLVGGDIEWEDQEDDVA